MILIPFGQHADKSKDTEPGCCASRPKLARTRLRKAHSGPIDLWKYPASTCVVNSFGAVVRLSAAPPSCPERRQKRREGVPGARNDLLSAEPDCGW